MTLLELAVARDELAERRERHRQPLSGVAAAALAAVVEAGIPIPPPRQILCTRRGLADKLRHLAVGESLLIPDRRNTDGLHGYWRHLAPQRYTARAVDGGVRVWRSA